MENLIRNMVGNHTKFLGDLGIRSIKPILGSVKLVTRQGGKEVEGHEGERLL